MSSLWNDEAIKRTVNYMDPQTRYKYAKMGERLYDVVASQSETRRNDSEAELLEAATQIRMMLRDGLLPTDLTDSERRLLISTFGADRMERDYGVVESDDEDDSVVIKPK